MLTKRVRKVIPFSCYASEVPVVYCMYVYVQVMTSISFKKVFSNELSESVSKKVFSNELLLTNFFEKIVE